ncbi:hypothetical protein [Bradyrhizobium sp. UFLA03-84]|uniref:hypothetical protein n=1 Tax=Bradyrhizobium sp. UFLA03-84 TaxID=418599 RepID=UPI0011779B50|nr:hypothetical protein [Bradyrhizobium sp. UFLA03-84]
MAHYKSQIALAEDRIRQIKDNVIGDGLVIPDAAYQAIENARRLIKAYQTGVRIIEQRLAQDARTHNDKPGM